MRDNAIRVDAREKQARLQIPELHTRAVEGNNNGKGTLQEVA
jgi:hypothetical protein